MNQTQTAAARSPRQWCDEMQTKLMAALDEAWRIGVVVYGDTSGDGVANFNIKVLGVSSLSASDFVL